MRSNREAILLPMDAEVAEAIIRLQDYFEFPIIGRGEKERLIYTFVSKVFGLVLVSLLLEDFDQGLDAFQRMLTHAEYIPPKQFDKAFSEFAVIYNHFQDLFAHQAYLKEALEDLLPSDLRVFLEEIFEVEYRADGTMLLVY